MKTALLAYTAALGMTFGLLLTGCTFTVGMDYTGKTAKDNKSFTPVVSYQEATEKNKLRY